MFSYLAKAIGKDKDSERAHIVSKTKELEFIP